MTLHETTSYKSNPGHPRWGVAPLSMAWDGKSLGDICRQLKDVNLNGGRDPALLQEHIAKDDLVAWGWNPGESPVNPLREIRKQPDSWSKLGSKAAQSAHNKFNLLTWVSDGFMQFLHSLSAL